MLHTGASNIKKLDLTTNIYLSNYLYILAERLIKRNKWNFNTCPSQEAYMRTNILYMLCVHCFEHLLICNVKNKSNIITTLECDVDWYTEDKELVKVLDSSHTINICYLTMSLCSLNSIIHRYVNNIATTFYNENINDDNVVYLFKCLNLV